MNRPEAFYRGGEGAPLPWLHSVLINAQIDVSF